MPPQTRRFLDLLHDMVTKLCAEKKIEQRSCLFTQRQARAFTGWSAFQVKKHIARLVELEYALPMRCGRGQQTAYELAYSGEGRDGAKFLMGLIEADALRGSMLPLFDASPASDYDGNREPLNGEWEPPSSSVVAPRLQGGSIKQNGSNPHEHRRNGTSSSLAAKNAQPEVVCNGAS